jgi:hypothetical protein
MSKRNRNKNLKQISTATTPWWRRAWVKVTLFPLGTIIAVVALAYTYTTSGADALRSGVYQPLYADLVKVENSIISVSIEQMPFTKASNDLKQSGAIERIPGTLKERLEKVFSEAGETLIAVLSVHEFLNREMSSRIMVIRTKEADREWLQKTSNALRDMSKSEKGKSDMFTLVEGATHESVSQGFDIRDPGNPIASTPGGPIFVVRDWLEYPASIRTIEQLWKPNDYLYFNVSKSDSWEYRLTREDLNRNSTTLENFLNPVHESLKQNPSFQKLLTERQRLQSEISKLKEMVKDRIRAPKQLRDLLNL